MATARNTPTTTPTAPKPEPTTPKRKRDNSGPLSAFRAAEMIQNARASKAKRLETLRQELVKAEAEGGKREQAIMARVSEGERHAVQRLLDAAVVASGETKLVQAPSEKGYD